MSWNIGDWTTWDGLAEEHGEEETVVFGKPAAKAAPAAAPVAAKREQAKAKMAGVSARGIEKKKKKPRGAGLMKVAESPKAQQPPMEEAVDGPSVPSPYILDAKNPVRVILNPRPRVPYSSLSKHEG